MAGAERAILYNRIAPEEQEGLPHNILFYSLNAFENYSLFSVFARNKVDVTQTAWAVQRSLSPFSPLNAFLVPTLHPQGSKCDPKM